jgi:hypothetical protein
MFELSTKHVKFSAAHWIWMIILLEMASFIVITPLSVRNEFGVLHQNLIIWFLLKPNTLIFNNL